MFISHVRARSLVLLVVGIAHNLHAEPVEEECISALNASTLLQTKSLSSKTSNVVEAPVSRGTGPQGDEKEDLRGYTADSEEDEEEWAGHDVLPHGAESSKHRASLLDVGRHKLRDFQIMGLYNSGTNLLKSLVLKNFPRTFRIGVQDADAPSTRPCSFWKHASLSTLQKTEPELLGSCFQNHVVGVAMIRNPLSWLASFKRAPYDLSDCAEGTDWVSKTCSYPDYMAWHLRNKTYSSVEKIWSTWARDYEALPSFGFQGGVLIRYEDLVLDTTTELRKIAASANVSMPEHLKQEDVNVSPSADFIDQSGRARAILKINSKSYLHVLSEEEQRDACSRLDQDVMLRHGYDDCAILLTN